MQTQPHQKSFLATIRYSLYWLKPFLKLPWHSFLVSFIFTRAVTETVLCLRLWVSSFHKRMLTILKKRKLCPPDLWIHCDWWLSTFHLNVLMNRLIFIPTTFDDTLFSGLENRNKYSLKTKMHLRNACKAYTMSAWWKSVQLLADPTRCPPLTATHFFTCFWLFNRNASATTSCRVHKSWMKRDTGRHPAVRSTIEWRPLVCVVQKTWLSRRVSVFLCISESTVPTRTFFTSTENAMDRVHKHCFMLCDCLFFTFITSPIRLLCARAVDLNQGRIQPVSLGGRFQ